MKSKSNGLYCKLIKRFMDFLIASLSIIIFSPLLIILAILVRVKLGGPVIFKQERPGLNGKVFKLYKFRTMTDAKDENGTTSGVSIALVFNKDGSVSAPRDHFLNAELLNYFNDKHQVDYQFIEDDLPPKLQDYQLVAGTAEAREILPRELEVIDF